MAYLDDQPVWEPGVRQLEESDDCEAGVFNVPLGQLAHRTQALNAMASPDGWGLVSDGRNLLTVLGVTTVADAVEALHKKINATGVPDFSGLQIGDYLDLASLNDGKTTYTWNASYKNLRIVIAGFNTYKHVGISEDKKNHIVFVFDNCPLTKAMRSSDDNRVYPSSTLTVYLSNEFLPGLVEALGHDYMHSVARYISKNGHLTYSHKIFLPTEIEVYGMQINGDESVDSAIDYRSLCLIQLPIFRDSYKRRIKRYNGNRQKYWLSTPDSTNLTSYCVVNTNGNLVSYNGEDENVGVAPAFCIE